ncbi:MAG TPA: polyprenol phosphomannose-dependent alpha 1,6 mannosyltransferase MptB [Acidimicrobiales bacterium]
MLSLSEGPEENATVRHRSPGRSLFSPLISLRALISMRLVSLLLRPTSLKARDDQEIYVADVTPLNKLLCRPALLGFVGSVAILAGASQQNSPFTLKLPGAWWFGIPASHPAPQIGGPGQWLFLGVFGVYGGMLLMLRAWYDVIQLASRIKGIPVRRLIPVFVAWTLPLLIVAPLFSNDAYSYAAQGELMSHHINPYLYGPGLLSTGTTFDALTARIWQNVTSPYGPVFLVADGWIVEAMRHNVLATVEALRGLALLGVVMFAAAVPSIARSFGRDQATAFSLAVLNPLILLNLVAGEHNDALMLGFLLSGYALFKRGRPVLGIFLCGIAAAIKIPGFIGVIYIGWEWLGTGKSVRERIRPMLSAFAIAGVAMAASSQLAGVGWRWVAGLSNPDSVRSWLDPATGLGLLAGQVAKLVGLGSLGHPLLTIARGSALALAVAIGLVLLLRSERIGSLSAIGWTLIAVAMLGPVLQPWYLAWGIVFLAPIAQGKVRKLVCGVSAVSCFLGLPGGEVLGSELENSNPEFLVLFSLLLVAIALVVVGPTVRLRIYERVRRMIHSREVREPVSSRA